MLCPNAMHPSLLSQPVVHRHAHTALHNCSTIASSSHPIYTLPLPNPTLPAPTPTLPPPHAPPPLPHHGPPHADEFVHAGNAGRFLFEEFFAGRLAPRQFLSVHFACAFRHWLRPSSAAVAVRERLRPSWSAAGASSDAAGMAVPTIGIHIRANGHLFNKRAGNSWARYDFSVLRQKCAHTRITHARGVAHLFYTCSSPHTYASSTQLGMLCILPS